MIFTKIVTFPAISALEKKRKKSAGIAVTFHNHTGSPLEPID
jgi:hypothetical protein